MKKTEKTITERIEAVQDALKGKLNMSPKRVKELRGEMKEIGKFVKRVSASYTQDSPVIKSLSSFSALEGIEAELERAKLDEAKQPKADKPRRNTGVLSRSSRVSAAQPEIKKAESSFLASTPEPLAPDQNTNTGNTASVQPPKTVDAVPTLDTQTAATRPEPIAPNKNTTSGNTASIQPTKTIDEQLDDIMKEIDSDVDLELAEAAEPGQKQPAAATTPDLSEQGAMAIFDAALEEIGAAPEAQEAQEPALKEPTVHSIEELEELKITDEEPSGPEPTKQEVEDAMAVLNAASGENDAAPVVQQEQASAPTAPAETKGVKLGTHRSGGLHTESEKKFGSLDESRMTAMMNAVRDIADQQGGVLEKQHGSIRGAAGASYTVKIGEVTIAIKRTANEASVNHLSDVTISIKSPQNDQAKKQAQALALEVIPKIATSVSQISDAQFERAVTDIQQAQSNLAKNKSEYKEAQEKDAFKTVDAAVNSKGRISNVNELRAAVKIITASEAYQDCHKQEFANDLKSIEKSFKPKAENAPKREHTDNEMEAFKAVEKLDKLLDLAKKSKNIPIVSNIAQSSLRQHLDKMKGPDLQAGLKELQTKKVENADVSRVSMSKK